MRGAGFAGLVYFCHQHGRQNMRGWVLKAPPVAIVAPCGCRIGMAGKILYKVKRDTSGKGLGDSRVPE